MTTRSRSEDLTADLLHDIDVHDSDGETVPTVSTPPPAAAPSPVVETSLFLAPRGWSRPRLVRTATSVSLSAGPVRVRIGRG